jgi:ferredoxin
VARDIRINRDLCMGSGQCLIYAPGTFDLDEESISMVVNPDADTLEDIQVAIDTCPTHAITLAAFPEPA